MLRPRAHTNDLCPPIFLDQAIFEGKMPILAGRRTGGTCLLLVLLVMVMLPFSPAASEAFALAKGDGFVLHALADEWMPEGWDAGDPCLWPGVECAVPKGEKERRVVSLSVRGVCVIQGHAERACDIPSNVRAHPPRPQTSALRVAPCDCAQPARSALLGSMTLMPWGQIGELKALESLYLNGNGLQVPHTLPSIPAPSTLNPQPSTLNPQPSTLNPQTSTLNPP